MKKRNNTEAETLAVFSSVDALVVGLFRFIAVHRK